ncbi:TsaB protein, required for threonylcarbamoyladenosine (t(6)A) formation in tRNA [Enhygromyxa salina]|uniref:TsaB protein, required for threonylcarbamoyladenosine (T(6)A) formation in tRNA n=1 Tax=Enhygromyxa salina TaxID=215803 RepID=A0A0C2D267_9BACT|nr:tRNA (adenosine(37)-N6)-threonylcarbamoyltransferase complex dimerization subunit type 1 TsaB [Enhygromyxa salina]KIG15875.1 TsaB protein, required for threonylcarbamoyladenosine (t(6)A) formation in tRNA [Enhygromyxa salina]
MLCFDASAPRTCVALGRVGSTDLDQLDQLIIEDESEDPGSQTSARLHLRLGAALERAGITAAQLDVVACGRGPGTFTGSRVAVATAKGLAIGLGVPVVPVSTLASLAGSAATNGRVLAVLDARRDQVYGALFNVGARIEALDEERVTELAALIASLPPTHRGADVTPLGPGCGPYADQLPEPMRAQSIVSPGPTAAGLWRAAVSALRAGAAVDPDAFCVTYLRQSYAQMGIHKPKRPVFKSPFV